MGPTTDVARRRGRDLERPADRVDTARYALQTGAIARRCGVEADPVVGDLEHQRACSRRMSARVECEYFATLLSASSEQK
jgi:hypothetical protein